jgi:hypothetical protein
VLVSVAGFKRTGLLRLLAWTALSAAVLTAGAPEPQGRRGGQGGGRNSSIDPTWFYDGRFVFCRVAFRNSPYGGNGGGWAVDYPRADLNLPFRTGQLTKIPISRDSRGEPNHVVVTLTDPNLFKCPFVMMTEPGGLYLDAEEAIQLRTYLEKGGFLWADDFWGEAAWYNFERELRKALPDGQFPIIDLPLDHPIFHMLYEVRYVAQIPTINHWFGSGFGTSERFDSTTPHARAINNRFGYAMVLMTHNTDFGDAFEREGENRAYFDRFATEGYSFGINVLIYAMTH